MQVTHVQDHINHAVIGGNQAIAFGISDSPEFFQILSSTLYKDQILAVCRETLCNAWDAHIEAGCTDRAVEVTLTSEKLTIRDFGKGIHHDMMGPIYGTYGNSTKKNDGGQTGGFGLGCKSPFAYTDHFEVQSFHQGTRTIYALSRSSAERNGKPGIMPVASFPTKETGLQVSIHLKSPSDYRRFEELLQRIARNGEMRIHLNNMLVNTLPISRTENGWFITRTELIQHERSSVYVRYGNVIYPVEIHSVYGREYTRVTGWLQKLSGSSYHSDYRIIFQAPPHSIAVTPSREGLSMQEHTISTIHGLLKGFLQDIETRLNQESLAVLDQRIADVSSKKLVGELLSDRLELPGMSVSAGLLRVTPQDLPHISTMADLARQYVQKRYPDISGFRLVDLQRRLDAALSLGVGKRGHLTQLRRCLTAKPGKPWVGNQSPEAWYKRRILRPLVRDMQASPVMDPGKLFILNNYHGRADNYNLVDAKRLSPRHFDELLPLQRNILILSRSKRDLEDRASDFPEMKTLGSVKNSFVYLVPQAKNALPEIREFWIKRGFTLLDLTVPQPWDPPKEPRKPKTGTDQPKKPKLTGYPALSGVHRSGCRTRVDNCFLDGAPRVEQPAFYLRVMRSRAEVRQFELGSFQAKESKMLVELFGKSCAVIHTDAQEETLKKAGLVPFDNYVVDYVIREVTTNPQFLAYWPESVDRARGRLDGEELRYSDKESLLTAVFDIAEVRSLLGLKTSLNVQELLVLRLWREIIGSSRFSYTMPPDGVSITRAQNLITKLPVEQSIKDLLKDNRWEALLPVLHFNEIRKLTQHPEAKTNGHLDRLAKLITVIFKG